MNILLINHYAGSKEHGMEYRPYYLAREWVRMGHTVTIAAASVSHVRTHAPEIKGTVTEEMIDGIRYLWFKTPAYEGNGLPRVINIFTFVGQLFRYRKWIAKTIKPNVVIASSTYPLDMIPARAISQQYHAKLVFEVHDLWPLSLIEVGGMSKYHPFILLLQWAENFTYRNADKVVSVLPKAMEHMLQHGMRSDQFVYIPNGVDVVAWQDRPNELPNEHKQALSILKEKKHFLVGYTGAHGLANALDYFIDAAYQMQEDPVSFVLVGKGPEKEKLMLKVNSRKQTNVIFLPPVEKRSIPVILQEMDALYIGLGGNPLFRFGVSPNKLIDYMMAAKPVIYGIQAGNDMVAESRCGISIPPEKPEEIARAVLQLMSLSAEARKQMGQKGRVYILANHDYRMLAKQFLASLERSTYGQ
jgi:glycosyltransferase involved in cell wall biosynthesis